MLLTTTEWDKVAKKPRMLNHEKYILCYFLGNISEEIKEKIKTYAEDNKCEIINILDPNSKYFSCGPSEFIYLEKHAFMVCTDSFHSSVFAILYHVPFIVFNREGCKSSMNSRIITLLKKFNLSDRLYQDNFKIEENNQINYSEVEKKLENERINSFTFLKKNIE